MSVSAKDRARNVYCAPQRLTTVAIIHLILTNKDTGLKILTNIHSREICVSVLGNQLWPQLSTFAQFPVLQTGPRHTAEYMYVRQKRNCFNASTKSLYSGASEHCLSQQVTTDQCRSPLVVCGAPAGLFNFRTADWLAPLPVSPWAPYSSLLLCPGAAWGPVLS